MPPAKKAVPAAKRVVPAAKKAAPAAKKTAPTTMKAAAPAKASPAKATTQATVTMKQLAAALAENHDLPSKQMEAVLSGLVALATRHLKRGDKLRLTGLGILQVRARPARMGRNPATGEAIKIKAKTVVRMRPSKGFKDAVLK